MESNTARIATLEATGNVDALNTGMTAPTEVVSGEELAPDESKPDDSSKEAPPSSKVADKYGDVDGLVKGYKSLQESYRQATTELGQIKASLREMEARANKERLESMTDSEKLEWLTRQHFEVSNKPSVEPQYNTGPMEDPEVESFIAANRELDTYGLSDMFRALATSEQLKNYTVESIYNTHVKPTLDRIAKANVTTVRRPMSPPAEKPKTGIDAITDRESLNKWIEQLNIEEYNVHRSKINELMQKFQN